VTEGEGNNVGERKRRRFEASATGLVRERKISSDQRNNGSDQRKTSPPAAAIEPAFSLFHFFTFPLLMLDLLK
jgi:hypothetical protein